MEGRKDGWMRRGREQKGEMKRGTDARGEQEGRTIKERRNTN